MKTRNKILALLMALALLFSLSACGKFETQMAVAAKKMEKLDSMRMDMNMGLSMNVSYLGESMDIEILMGGQANMTMDPRVMLMDMGFTLLMDGEEALNQDMSYFARQIGDSYELFTNVDGEEWEKTSVSQDELPMNTEPELGMDFLKDLASSFEETGKEEIRGSTATVYEGTISGDQLKTMFDMLGLKSLDMEDLFDGSMGVELPPLDVSSLGDIPATIAIDDENKMVVRYSIDMTDMSRKLVEYVLTEVVKQLAAESGVEEIDMDELGLAIVVDELKATVEIYDFNQVDAIPTPEGIDEAV